MLVLDIETIPDSAEAELIELPPVGDPPKSITSLKSPQLRAAREAEWREQKAIEAEQKREAEIAKLALQPWQCRIVAVGSIRARDVKVPDVQLARDEAEERQLLDRLLDDLESLECRPVITWGGLNFDLYVVRARSLILEVRFDWKRIEELFVPFQPLVHCDLQFELARGRRDHYARLGLVARRLGCEVEDEITGADVLDAYQREDWEAIRKHCSADVVRTAYIWRKTYAAISPKAARVGSL